MKRIFFLLSIFALLIPAACKPTEKGYKSAYDAALNKRQAALDAIDAQIPAHELQEVDGMQIKTIDGVKVFLMNQRLTPLEDSGVDMENYNVAVGAYKMITNCKAQVEALREEGFRAFVAQDADGMFYSIAGSFKFVNEAAKFYSGFKKSAKRVYVGLHNDPVIIYSPN